MRTDTHPEAEAVRNAVRRRLSGPERLLIALDMSLYLRELARAGLRRQHPEWSEARISREILRRAFPPEELPDVLR